ncbi:hypothetical protein M0805_009753 [Coniferiporia weirii]|nr:hypothetical protein M0805_009753 [Coniferiporia weirii]
MPSSQIVLEPSSLYIATQPLMNQGVFHWSLFLTDAAGTVSRHHWAVDSPTDAKTAERYVVERVRTPIERAQWKSILGFFRVEGYARPKIPTEFPGLCSAVFPRSHTTVEENRKHGITCRAWMMDVLTKMCETGIIDRKRGPEGLEDVVKRLSTEREMVYLRSYLSGEEYEAVVAKI